MNLGFYMHDVFQRWDVQAFLRNVKNDEADSQPAVATHKHIGRILEEGIFRLAAPVGAAMVHDFPVESGHHQPFSNTPRVKVHWEALDFWKWKANTDFFERSVILEP